jgi:hypothetical protein
MRIACPPLFGLIVARPATAVQQRRISMDEWKLPWEGGCRCGAVRLRVTAPPMMTLACHCAGCRKMSASAFSLSVTVPAEGFEVIQGRPVIGGLHGPQAHHHHCDHCKSWMFTRVEGLDFFVNLRTTMLDAHDWAAPFVETCTGEKLPWAETPAAHSFATFPGMDEWQSLMTAFAAKGPRP